MNIIINKENIICLLLGDYQEDEPPNGRWTMSHLDNFETLDYLSRRCRIIRYKVFYICEYDGYPTLESRIQQPLYVVQLGKAVGPRHI